MEVILSNPGFQHIAENVFLNLNYEKLETCRLVNVFCKDILDNPMFWLKKFIRRGLSKKNQIDWMAAIQITPHWNLETSILNYLKQSSKNERVIDIPCHINEETLSEYSEKIIKLKEKDEDLIFEQLDDEIRSGNDNVARFQILALFMDNYKVFPEDGIYPILEAANRKFENPQIMKILAPLTKNLNAPEEETGHTPIHWAVLWEHKEIVKILAPLTDNPNAPDEFGFTPIHSAAKNGCTEIVKILAPLTDNPNAPDEYGEIPIYLASRFGHTEIVKILCPLTDNPNAPRWNGINPISMAIWFGHTEIVKILAPLTDNTELSPNFAVLFLEDPH